MKNTTSIDQRSNASSRQMQAETAMLRRDLRQLGSKIAGLRGGGKPPVIRTPRHMIPKTISGNNLAGYAGIAMALLIDAGVFGDATVSAGGKVKTGLGPFSFSASQKETQGSVAGLMGGDGGDGSGGDCNCGDNSAPSGSVNSGYMSGAQNAARQYSSYTLNLRIR